MMPVSDGGSVTPVVAALVGVCVTVGIALTATGAVLADHTRVQGIADRSALVAAYVDREQRALGTSAEDSLALACAQAQGLASVDGAVVTQCKRASGHSIVVEVTMARRALPPHITGTARAGPRVRTP